MNIKEKLDCSGLGCPMPILKTKKLMDTLTSGDILQVITTELASVNDMESWCKNRGHVLLQKEEQNGKFIFHIRKK